MHVNGFTFVPTLLTPLTARLKPVRGVSKVGANSTVPQVRLARVIKSAVGGGTFSAKKALTCAPSSSEIAIK